MSDNQPARVRQTPDRKGRAFHLGQRLLCQISNNTEESMYYVPTRILKTGLVSPRVPPAEDIPHR
jgi:hypothetical protein